MGNNESKEETDEHKEKRRENISTRTTEDCSNSYDMTNTMKRREKWKEILLLKFAWKLTILQHVFTSNICIHINSYTYVYWTVCKYVWLYVLLFWLNFVNIHSLELYFHFHFRCRHFCCCCCCYFSCHSCYAFFYLAS